MENKNPHNICTWDNQADCQSCNIQGKLVCKWDKKILTGFHGISWPPVLTAIIGMVIVRYQVDAGMLRKNRDLQFKAIVL